VIEGRITVQKFDRFGCYEGSVEGRNTLLLSGMDRVWALVTGANGEHFDNLTAQIGVGDSAAPADAGQMGLQALTNTAWHGMEPMYPAIAGGVLMLKAVFGPTEANFDWNEFVVRHAMDGVCLDRGVEKMGKKPVGSVWIANVDLFLQRR
jgi:hypothetical protein